MALRLIEGFELQDPDVLASRDAGTAIATTTPSPRTGSGAAYLEVTGFGDEAETEGVLWDAANDTLWAGVAFNTSSIGTGDATFLYLRGYVAATPTDVTFINFGWRSGDGGDGTIGVKRFNTNSSVGGTAIANSAAGAITANTWHYVELKWLWGDGATGAIEVWVDGVSVINVTSIDTAYDVVAPDRVKLGFKNIGNPNLAYFDDVYILDTETVSPETGTSPNTGRLGDVVVEILAPTSDAVPNNFTRSAGANNYELVDDYPPDGDTTYVHSNTSTDEDRYGLGNRVHTGTVVGVSVQAKARRTAGTARLIEVGLVSNTGATLDAQPESMTLADGTYTLGQKTYDRDFHDEVTAADWTTAKVNALEATAVVQ